MNIYNCVILVCSTILFLLAASIYVASGRHEGCMIVMRLKKDYCFIPPYPYTTVLYVNGKLYYYTLYDYTGYCSSNLETGVLIADNQKFKKCLLPVRLAHLMFSTGHIATDTLPDYVLNMDDLLEYIETFHLKKTSGQQQH